MIEDEKDFFNELADRWDEKETVSPEKYRRIIKEVHLEEKQTILDVGTGTGILIPYLLEVAGNIQIFAIDYAERMIEKLRLKNFPDNVRAFVMDIHKTDFKDNFFDRIIVNSSYPHFKNKKTALKEIYRIMKPNGMGIICHPSGRKYVNNLHADTHPLIAQHIVENISELKMSIQLCGFKFLKGIDEENFFLVSFTKYLIQSQPTPLSG